MKPNLDYRNYLLGIMVLVGVVSIFDRFVFALVLEPIKHDLGLSDSQLGLMSGIAFSVFYATAGIPIARWADTGNRVNLVTLTTGLLGVMLTLCGFVTSFIQLLLVRAGVAIGEAGCMPTAQSLLADYFEREERPRAMAFFAMFYPISMIVGYLLGGWMVDQFGWRMTFILLGVPALLVALLVKFTLKEPRLQKASSASEDKPSLTVVFSCLWASRAFRHVLFAFCITYFFLMGTGQWLPAFFMRTHGVGTMELGAWLALGWGVFGILGNYTGGYLATRYAANKEGLQLRCLAFTFIFGGMANAVTYLTGNTEIALVFVAVGAFFLTLCNGPIFSVVQSLVAEKQRSVALAIVLFFANLIGFGLGPLAIGVLSDFLIPRFGEESLRYALVFSTPGVVWIAFHYWQAGRTVEEEISSTESRYSLIDNTEQPAS